MENKSIDKKKLIIAIAAVAVIAIVAIVLLILGNGGVRATTMRLLRMEGTVTLEENGKSKTIIDNLRLKSGNAINTEGSSLASIGLDETKIVTMDELSRAEFSQKGKKLDLNLTRGSLFFEVKKPLEDDESFDIRTSTMVVGIRGTSGYVTVDSDGNWNIVVTDGKVHVTGTNPNTGEVKEIDVEAGQRCTVYLYDRDKDSVMFTLDEVTEDEIPDFVVTILREEPELLEKVVSDTDWSKPVILGIEEVEKEPVTEEETEEESDAVSDNDKDKTENETLTEAAEQDNVRETTPTSSAKTRVQPYIASEMNGMIILADGTVFDPEYYAMMHPELATLYGNDKYALLEHYLSIGKSSGLSANEQEEQAKAAALAAAVSDSEEDDEDEDEDSSSNVVVVPQITYSLGANNEIYMGNTQIGTFDSGNANPITITQAGTVSLPITIGNNAYTLHDINYTSIPDGANFTSSNYDITYNNGSFSGTYTNNDGLYEIIGSNATSLNGGLGSTFTGPNNTSMTITGGQAGASTLTYTDPGQNSWNVGSFTQYGDSIAFNDGSNPNNTITPNRTINSDGTVS